MHRFMLLCTSLLISVPVYTMLPIPKAVGVVPYNYDNDKGRNISVFKAYPQGTLANLEHRLPRNRAIAVVGLSCFAFGYAVGTSKTLAKKIGFKFGTTWDEEEASQFARNRTIGSVLTICCGLIGARSVFLSGYASRIIKRRVPISKLSFNLNRLNNINLKDETLEWVEFKTTTPIKASII
jgi:hypothetical protein